MPASCIALREGPWQPPPKPRPRRPPRERLRLLQKRSTNASTAIAPSVAANTEVDTSDRVSLLTFFNFTQARDEGQKLPLRAPAHGPWPPPHHQPPHPPSSPLTFFADIPIVQTQRSALLSAKNVEVRSSVEISCSATTEPYMPKMEECLFSLKGGKEQAQQRHRPRTQSRPSISTRARWSR